MTPQQAGRIRWGVVKKDKEQGERHPAVYEDTGDVLTFG
jgi:hypothetical protein